MKLINFSALLVLCAFFIHSSNRPLFWPLPRNLQINATSAPLQISPCDIRYNVESQIYANVMEILQIYQTYVFKCKEQKESQITLNVFVGGSDINLPLETQQEAYSLIIRANGIWELQSAYYTGFLRGFQTFSQIFQKNAQEKYFVEGIPIVIDDSPQLKWRGLLIDSARHFLPVDAIKDQIDMMMFNKMNVLHWHIIDQESFPFEVPTVPELSSYGQIRGTYSPQDIRQITMYAKRKGVRVVAQIDTPAHTQSWGRSDKYKDIIVNCFQPFAGQFDPTLNLTYEVVKQVMNYTSKVFEDPYIHFGGDEVDQECWDKRPSIRQWMDQNNIKTYEELSVYYRIRQKEIYRKDFSKKVIYWANEEINLPLQTDDVLQWWGLTENLSLIANKPNEVILSNYHDTYLDLGYGGLEGDDYGTYVTWRNLYKLQPSYPGVNVIGGEVCMWGELANAHNIQQKIWIRASVLAERLWNSKIDLKTSINDIARRLNAQARRMRARGFKTSVVSVQLCEENVEICF